jgi:DNA-binding transcriptional MerR regulator
MPSAPFAESENPSDSGGADSTTTDTHADMTIDEIARFGDIPVSTVRMYQNKGLLPPPEKRGRVGYYGEVHRRRLGLISDLQDRGFSLAAIKDSLDAWQSGSSLADHLGIDGLGPSFAQPGRKVRHSMADMAQRFEGVELTQEIMRRAADLGVVEIDGTDVVQDAVFSEIGPAIVRIGIPVESILDEYEVLQDSVAVIADRFAEVFETHVWSQFVDDGMPVDQVADLTANVSQLASLATTVVTNELHDQFAKIAADYVERSGMGD